MIDQVLLMTGRLTRSERVPDVRLTNSSESYSLNLRSSLSSKAGTGLSERANVRAVRCILNEHERSIQNHLRGL